jgi:hypothetical protein
VELAVPSGGAAAQVGIYGLAARVSAA